VGKKSDSQMLHKNALKRILHKRLASLTFFRDYYIQSEEAILCYIHIHKVIFFIDFFYFQHTVILLHIQTSRFVEPLSISYLQRDLHTYMYISTAVLYIYI
jgi:hypothetical protein